MSGRRGGVGRLDRRGRRAPGRLMEPNCSICELATHGCGKLRARWRAQLATHAPPRRLRRRPRLPAPRRDLPRRRYGSSHLANPTVPARESPRSSSRIGRQRCRRGGFRHREATTSSRLTWPRRRSTRAACLPGAVRGGGPILDIDDRPRARQATSNRAPRRARMRSITATTSCPVGAPRSPARHFARWRGGARQGAHPLEGTLRQDLAQADYGAAR